MGRNNGNSNKSDLMVSAQHCASHHCRTPMGFFCTTLNGRRIMSKLMLTLMAGLFAMSVNGVAIAADPVKMDAKSMQATADGDYKAAKAKIKGDSEAAEAQCKKMAAAEKKSCKKDAEAKEKAAKADAKAAYDKAKADAKAMKKAA
ncbi:MAG TPA: cell envelope biogenesis protein TolA [Casimicrobiaceae bacterium]|nr:cell envelope biogenesis protein TolA [Casimicrobiaceae bacterium]